MYNHWLELPFLGSGCLPPGKIYAFRHQGSVYFPWMLRRKHIVRAIPNANIRSLSQLLHCFWYNYKIIHLGVLRPLLVAVSIYLSRRASERAQSFVPMRGAVINFDLEAHAAHHITERRAV